MNKNPIFIFHFFRKYHITILKIGDNHPYYRQTVIDEKQARIDELEQQVKTMIRQVITENLNFKHRCQPLVLQAQKIVIDEKHARIDELEQQVTTMIISSTMIIIIVIIIVYTSVDNEVS